MRFKKLIGGLTLAAVMALGVGAALSVNKVGEAKAATSETTFYVDVRDSLWGYSNIGDVKARVWGDTPGDVYPSCSIIEVGGVNYATFSIASYPGAVGVKIYCWNESKPAHISEWKEFSTDFSEGQNLIIVGNNGEGWESENNQPVTLDTLIVSTMYTVTKHGVCDGDTAHAWVIDSSDKVEEGNSYAYPARINLEGYHFGGWYKDLACTEAYTAQTVNADLDIYAKYTTLSKDSYIYYVSGSKDDTPNMIHTWGGDVEYVDRDIYIAGIASDVHGVMNFQGVEQKIYKIPVSSESEDTNFKFHYNNWADESGELSLVAGNAYVWSNDPYNEEAAGDALDFILALEEKRNAVTASGDIKDYSVCGISTADATNLCEAYNALSDDAREDFVDVSDVWTYDRQDSSKEAHVLIYDIMDELASKAGIVLKGHASARFVSVFGSEASNNSFAIIAIIALVSVSAIAILVVYKKRKHE